MTSEKVFPMYYNQEALLKPPADIYRADLHGNRFYYSLDENGNMRKYPSVTTVLGSVMPTSEFLIKWVSDHGSQKANQLKNEMADYGTMLHICIAEYLLKRKFNFDELPVRIDMHKHRHGIRYYTAYWEGSLQKDIYAFHMFAIDYQVEPLAIEIMLMSDTLKVAGAIDLALMMTIGSGINGKVLKKDIVYNKDGSVKEDNRRKIMAILDVKSGKKGFYPNHEAQLHIYGGMWTENFPHLPPQALYNWAPKDWTDEPGYHLKDQIESPQRDVIRDYIHIFNRLYNRSEERYPFIAGTILYGELDNNLQLETWREHMSRLGQLKGVQQVEAIEDDGFDVAPPVETKTKRRSKPNVTVVAEKVPVEVVNAVEAVAEQHTNHMTDGSKLSIDKETGEVQESPIYPFTEQENPEDILNNLFNMPKEKTA